MNADTRARYEAIRDRALAAMPIRSHLRAIQRAANRARAINRPTIVKAEDDSPLYLVHPDGTVVRWHS